MEKVRIYGEKPYKVAVIHGGPGAPGEMAPVARELAQSIGVLEPFQLADSIEGQLHELKEVLEEKANSPVRLIGHSWGAWLSFIFAARWSSLVEKVILVGSGPFEVSYVTGMNETRLGRLTEDERRRVERLTAILQESDVKGKETIFAEFGGIFSKTDTYCPISSESEVVCYQPEVFQKIMDEATQLRAEGRLVVMGTELHCPVVAIHGDYDPHPFQGVQEPLSRVLKDFHFTLLNKCGHTPWNECYAKKRFYETLKTELGL